MAIKGLRDLCRSPYIYLVVSVIFLIVILAGMMFYKNRKEGIKEGVSSSEKCDPPCGKITTESTCLATPASTPSGYCHWNQPQGIYSHENPPFTSYCATSKGNTPLKCSSPPHL